MSTGIEPVPAARPAAAAAILERLDELARLLAAKEMERDARLDGLAADLAALARRQEDEAAALREAQAGRLAALEAAWLRGMGELEGRLRGELAMQGEIVEALVAARPEAQARIDGLEGRLETAEARAAEAMRAAEAGELAAALAAATTALGRAEREMAEARPPARELRAALDAMAGALALAQSLLGGAESRGSGGPDGRDLGSGADGGGGGAESQGGAPGEAGEAGGGEMPVLDAGTLRAFLARGADSD
jgi:chromosome segregation ATPase